MNDTRNDDLEGMGKIANMIDIDAAADQAAQDESDQAEMVDATMHRGVSCHHQTRQVVPDEVFGPVATDFTSITPSPTTVGNSILRVKLDSGDIIVGCMEKDEAEKVELAINQAMIEYRTKRNAYEKGLVANAH